MQIIYILSKQFSPVAVTVCLLDKLMIVSILFSKTQFFDREKPSSILYSVKCKN